MQANLSGKKLDGLKCTKAQWHSTTSSLTVVLESISWFPKISNCVRKRNWEKRGSCIRANEGYNDIGAQFDQYFLWQNEFELSEASRYGADIWDWEDVVVQFWEIGGDFRQ